METADRSRRRFLAALTSAAGALFLLGKWLSPRRRPREASALLTVPRSEIPDGGALVFREKGVAVVREGNEIRALGLACTHLGCTVSVAPEGLSCPCHGSRFDRKGAVIRGPAERPLPLFPVETRGDSLVVFGETGSGGA